MDASRNGPKKACDRCRRRKVKCDIEQANANGVECANCRISNFACVSTFPVKRRGPKPRRLGNINNTHGNYFDNNGTESPAVDGDGSSDQLLENSEERRTPGDNQLLEGSEAGRTPREDSRHFQWSSPSSTWIQRHGAPVNADTPMTVSHSPLSHVTLASTSTSRHMISQDDIYQELVATLLLVIPTLSFEAITSKCFDLYFEYLFPLMPIVHELSLRVALKLVWTRKPQTVASPSSGTLQSYVDTAFSGPDTVTVSTGFEDRPMRLQPANLDLNHFESTSKAHHHDASMFTLVTALCAESASMIPVQLFPEGNLVADAFLQASRRSLHEYMEADLEHPNANSIVIRYFHSNCLHAAGKPIFSWHIFGEAARLAQVMRLHDESSYAALDVVEAELRRRVFWILYIGDKSAAILNHRPIMIHKFSFESGITVKHPSEIDDVSIQPIVLPSDKNLPRTIMTGFSFNLRLWEAASDLFLEMRIIREAGGNEISSQTFSTEQRSNINNLYVHFMTCLDDLPPWLHMDPGIFNLEDDSKCAKEFVVQRVNLQVSFHCLRMVITQKLDEASISSLGIGFEQSSTLALRKTEIAKEMIRAIREPPFWALQLNGESCVEKIRLIGASLLEVIHTNQDSPLAARARAEFQVLLDILTRLDSKASDALRNWSIWQG